MPENEIPEHELDEKEPECSQEQPEETSNNENEHTRAPKSVTVTDLELRELKKEANEYKDKYLRLLADAENTRKRMQKERQELTQYALENAIVDFLHPLDNLENALLFAENMSDDVKNWAKGFQMILTQFKEALANNGVVPVTAKGQPFDAHLHEAVEMIGTDEKPPGTILEECIRGYKMGNRTIRPARVKVAKAKEQETEEQ